MPRMVVVLDIDAYAKDPRRPSYKGSVEKGEVELGGWCPQCDKDFLDAGEVMYGKPVFPDGSDWFGSGKSFFDGAAFAYETKTLDWLFENYQLWNREDTIAVCSKECAEVRELRFRQAQAEIEMKTNPFFNPDSVVFHGIERTSPPTPLSVDPSSPFKKSEIPAFPTSPLSEAPLSPLAPNSPVPPPSSPPQHATPSSAFKKSGRAPPPPPPTRSPFVPPPEPDMKAVSENNANGFEHTPSSPSSFSSSPSSSSPPPPFEFVEPPVKSGVENGESKADGGVRQEQNVAWCLDELAKLQTTLLEATRRVGELTAVLEGFRRLEGVHPPPPLPPLPEEDHVRLSPVPAPSAFAVPVVVNEADDVN